VFVGNKNDIGELGRKVSQESGEQVCHLLDCIGHNNNITKNEPNVPKPW